jgi:hypothetical protein
VAQTHRPKRQHGTELRALACLQKKRAMMYLAKLKHRREKRDTQPMPAKSTTAELVELARRSVEAQDLEA